MENDDQQTEDIQSIIVNLQRRKLEADSERNANSRLRRGINVEILRNSEHDGFVDEITLLKEPVSFDELRRKIFHVCGAVLKVYAENNVTGQPYYINNDSDLQKVIRAYMRKRPLLKVKLYVEEPEHTTNPMMVTPGPSKPSLTELRPIPLETLSQSRERVELMRDYNSGARFVYKTYSLHEERERKRSQRELDALVALRTIRGVIQLLLTHTPDEQHLVLILEWIPGGTLKDAIEAGKKITYPPLPMTLILKYSIDLFSTLEIIHDKSFVHGDIKPENILVHIDGSLKITDFGVACNFTSNNGKRERSYEGTPRYSPPEAFNSHQWCPSRDIWSMGLTILQMATGKQPWEEEPQGKLELFIAARLSQEYVLRNIDLPINAPTWFEELIITQTLRVDPGQRYSASQIVHALQQHS